MPMRFRSVRSRLRIRCGSLVFALAFVAAGTARVGAGHLETWYRLDEVLEGMERVDIRDTNTYYAEAGWYYKILSNEDGRTVLRMLRHRDENHQSAPGEVSAGGTYEVNTALTELHRTFVQGVSVGVLAVPFKYRLEAPGGDDVVTNSATIGASIGARFRLGSELISAILQPLVFVGFTRIPVSTAEPDPRERNGLTYGAGFVADLGHDAQVGLIIGWDRIADGEPPNWPFQDRPWLSLGLGFKFLGG